MSNIYVTFRRVFIFSILKKSNINFVKLFFFPLICILPFGFLNYFFLKKSGEILSLNEIISYQLNNNGIYGSALYTNVYPYKIALYSKIKPEIVVIGSSTVLQFREKFFNGKFVNLGRTVNYPFEGEKLISDILKIHKPKIIIFGIDFWWGNNSKEYTEGLNFNHHIDYGQKLSPDGIIAPFKWILSGKFELKDYFNIISNSSDYKQTNYLGINAKFNRVGFAKDGSLYELNKIYKNNYDIESRKFSKTLKRIHLKSNQFIVGKKVSDERLKSIKNIIFKLNSAGVNVITFINPLPPLIYDKIQQNKKSYSYINLFRNKLIKIHNFHYDFFNPYFLKTSNCEFLDGFHGGDIVAARILNSFSKDKKNNITKFINKKYLKFLLLNYKDMVLANNYYKNKFENEIDFLDFGCNKIPKMNF